MITFTDTFYNMLFKQDMKICKAFEHAQMVVNVTHSPEQALIFTLLTQEELRGTFGKKLLRYSTKINPLSENSYTKSNKSKKS